MVIADALAQALDTAVFLAPVVLVLGALAGAVCGAIQRPVAWVRFFVGLAAVLMVAASVSCFAKCWTDWRRRDLKIEAQMVSPEAERVQVERRPGGPVVSIMYRGDFSVHYKRRPFEPPYLASLQLGAILGILGAVLGLVTRALASVMVNR